MICPKSWMKSTLLFQMRLKFEGGTLVPPSSPPPFFKFFWVLVSYFYYFILHKIWRFIIYKCYILSPKALLETTFTRGRLGSPLDPPPFFNFFCVLVSYFYYFILHKIWRFIIYKCYILGPKALLETTFGGLKVLFRFILLKFSIK